MLNKEPSNLLKEYQNWILQHHDPLYVISQESFEYSDCISFKTDYATATVSINIVEV